MPSPRTYTSVLAVPRSMARSFENSPARRLINITLTLIEKTCVGVRGKRDGECSIGRRQKQGKPQAFRQHGRHPLGGVTDMPTGRRGSQNGQYSGELALTEAPVRLGEEPAHQTLSVGRIRSQPHGIPDGRLGVRAAADLLDVHRLLLQRLVIDEEAPQPEIR